MIDDELQTVAERKKKTKPKFQLGRFLWKARVKTTISSHAYVENKQENTCATVTQCQITPGTH